MVPELCDVYYSEGENARVCSLLLFFIFQLTILLKSGYGSSERDQIFDPMANPNIRIAADDSVNVV